ncbi:MAG: response regulator transcription factor [Firmicutes bacterium]|nr:response regulator transcription factor [Bacillota bacterium]
MRVLILDDHPVLRKGIAALLAERDDLEVVGEADNIFDAVSRAKDLKADTILIDLHLRGIDGARAAQLLRDFLPGVKITLFGDATYSIMPGDGGAAGERGYDGKPGPSGEERLAGAIDAPTASDVTFGSRHYHDEHVSYGGYIRDISLTRTEEKVMELLARGYRNQAIADALFISVNTVKTHVHSIFRKLKVKSRAEAISVVLNSGARKGMVDGRFNTNVYLNHTFR